MFRSATTEQELALLPLLCRSDRAGLDVGAAAGVYSVQMCGLVSHCIAFEPRPEQAELLRKLARYAGLPITVAEVAASDADGSAVLRVPRSQQGLSTIDASNPLADADSENPLSVDVVTTTLDTYCNSMQVGFVKIDVEGHEGAVLAGAGLLLRNQRPRLLIEAEDRHHPGTVSEVFGVMRSHDYAGFFVDDHELRPVSEFVPSIHQDAANSSGWKNADGPQPLYVNNFIFVPTEESAAISALADKFLACNAGAAKRR